jgi:aminoglycoside/choline kinase family phosphotransferase
MSGDRAGLIDGFLAAAGWGGADRRKLADDASFRRYDRVRLDGRHAVLMDAPPDKEDVAPFVTVARLLADIGLSAPRILAEDRENGFLLLEDLGDATYTRVLAEGGDEAALYALATDTLIALHARYRPGDAVPTYSVDKLLTEASLLTDWYWPEIKGAPCPAAEREAFLSLWRAALEGLSAPTSLVLRDYHVDNLMHLPDRDGVAACGLLDFQDAVIGSTAYDLVSLLEDARRDVSPDLARAMITRYLAAFPDLDPDAFRRDYAILGAQRATKIVGIFTRLYRRDGKPGYPRHIPRTWRWLEGGLRHPALADIREWMDARFPPSDRRAPEVSP